MGRSLKKGPWVPPSLLKKVTKAAAEKSSKPIKTWARGSMIVPEMIGLTLSVHTGKKFLEVYVSESMVGHRLGEFAPTRTFKGHPKKK